MLQWITTSMFETNEKIQNLNREIENPNKEIEDIKKNQAEILELKI